MNTSCADASVLCTPQMIEEWCSRMCVVAHCVVRSLFSYRIIGKLMAIRMATVEVWILANLPWCAVVMCIWCHVFLFLNFLVSSMWKDVKPTKKKEVSISQVKKLLPHAGWCSTFSVADICSWIPHNSPSEEQDQFVVPLDSLTLSPCLSTMRLQLLECVNCEKIDLRYLHCHMDSSFSIRTSCITVYTVCYMYILHGWKRNMYFTYALHFLSTPAYYIIHIVHGLTTWWNVCLVYIMSNQLDVNKILSVQV